MSELSKILLVLNTLAGGDQSLLVCSPMVSYASNYMDGLDPAHIGTVHRRYGEILSRSFRAPTVEYTQSRDPDRRIRVGVLSADLRRHSVAFFIEPLLKFADRSAFEIVAFSTTNPTDDFTERLKKSC